MTTTTRVVWFSGLDPVPIRVTIAEDAAETAIFSAACLPDSLFLRTVQPYRLQQLAPDTYALVLGPQGFGAVLLDALRWLAGVAAAGIITALPPEHVQAFVKHYLDSARPDWRFEEITEHAATFLQHRYQHAATDAEYRSALANTHHNSALAMLLEELRQWHAAHY
jgi:hypothetical protein